MVTLNHSERLLTDLIYQQWMNQPMKSCNSAPFTEVSFTVTYANGETEDLPLPDCIDEKHFYPNRTFPAVAAISSQADRYANLFALYLSRDKVPKRWLRQYILQFQTSLQAKEREPACVQIRRQTVDLRVY